MIWRRLAYAAAVVLMATTTACNVDRAGGTAVQEVRVLTFAQPNAGDPPADLTHWADEVNRLTDGHVRVEFRNGWHLGEAVSATASLDDVKAGKVDLAWVGPQVLELVGVTSFQALLAPMLVDSYDLERAVFEDGIPKQMLSGLGKAGLVGIGVLPGPLRRILGITSAFVAPRDFVGKVIGMGQTALTVQTIAALGGTLKAPPFSASLDGLDGLEAHLGAITGNGYQAFAKAVTGNLNPWPRPLVIVAGESVYATLSPQQQQALTQAVDTVVPDALESSRVDDDDSAAVLCSSGFTIASVDEEGMAAFRKALEPVYASLRKDPTNATFLQRIEALKKSVGAPPERVDCARSRDAGGAIPNGTYEHPVTSADIEKYCRPDDPTAAAFSNLPATGLTLQLDVNGQRLIESEFPVGQPTAKEVGWTGTYRAYRNTFELIEDRHPAPLVMTWSLDGQRLQLIDWPADDCAGEIVWTSHAWVRVGS